MNHLFRELAPVSDASWAEIEEEAKRTLAATLAARKLVDFSGPKGWTESAVNTGRARPTRASFGEGVVAAIRDVQPMVELKAPFELSREELASIDRGAKDADLDPVVDAARHIALAEDRAVFYGQSAANIRGICESAPGEPISLSSNYEEYPLAVATAVSRLHAAGVGGPYAIALGQQCYTGIIETTKGGYPVIEHVKRLLDGPIVWAPALDGAVVVSLRGDDFQLTIGRDFSIGYTDHTADVVRLYLQESMTFRVFSPQAAAVLSYATKGGGRKSKS